MAISNRLFLDHSGKMFVPMNVAGGYLNDYFFTTTKMITLTVLALSGVFLGLWLKDAGAPLNSYVIVYVLWGLVAFYSIRFIIFEERYYYKMYLQLKEYEITTPAVFWDIASIKDTRNGAILTYSDAKIGILVRLERDTITGKPAEFIETHYDAISDFYRDVIMNNYNFVQLNIMEQAGNDPRIEELDKLLYNCDNSKITWLMERQIGYIKNITRRTLYESEYILFYTTDLTKLDTLIDDCMEMLYKLMEGAYIGYRVLSSRDIVEFMKEEYGVKYFNYTDATLTMFKKHGISTKNPFELTTIIYSDGEKQVITPAAIYRINRLTADILSGAVDAKDIHIKDTVYPEFERVKIKESFASFDALSESDTPMSNKDKPKKKRGFFGRKKSKDGSNLVDQSNTVNASNISQGDSDGAIDDSSHSPSSNLAEPDKSNPNFENGAEIRGAVEPVDLGKGKGSVKVITNTVLSPVKIKSLKKVQAKTGMSTNSPVGGPEDNVSESFSRERDVVQDARERMQDVEVSVDEVDQYDLGLGEDLIDF